MTGADLRAGSLRLDGEDRVWRGGDPLSLSGKPVQLLRLLMENPGRLVTKDEIFTIVWGGLAVSDSVLTTAVKSLRQALGDSARNPTIIETVHGRGYRFLLEVAPADAAVTSGEPEPAQNGVEDTAALPPPSGRRATGWPVALLVLFLALLGLALWQPWNRHAPGSGKGEPAPRRVAVLPFSDLSPDQSGAWFASGLTEEVAASLARTPDIHVAAGAPAMQIDAAGEDRDRTARSLGVSHVLEGSIRRDASRARVTVSLVDTGSGERLWSKSYDAKGSDIIAVQEDIAVRIATALRTVLDPAQLRQMMAVGTRSVEAYDAYLRGLAADQQQLDEGNLEHARAAAQAYEEARLLDPGFAAAHWRAARSWYGNATRVDSVVHPGTSQADRAAAFFERVDAAIETAPNPADKLLYSAFAAAMRLRLRDAHRLIHRYVEARPRDIDGWEVLADISAWAGDRAALARAADRVHRLSMEGRDPRSRAITLSVMAMDLDAAQARAREQLALKPDSALIQYQAHRAAIWGGDVAQASSLLARVRASELPPANKTLAEMRQACAEGRSADAARLRAKLAGSDLNTRWQAAKIVGDDVAAEALLRPLDEEQSLPVLMQYAINPSFDASRFPRLAAALEQNAIALPQPVPMPGRCSGQRASG